jgi:hypothetical protein
MMTILVLMMVPLMPQYQVDDTLPRSTSKTHLDVHESADVAPVALEDGDARVARVADAPPQGMVQHAVDVQAPDLPIVDNLRLSIHDLLV